MRWSRLADTSPHDALKEVAKALGPIGFLLASFDVDARLRGLVGPLLVGLGLGAVDLELLMPMGNFDLQTGLNGAQMCGHGAAKMRHAGIVVRREVVSDNQADNPQWKIDKSLEGLWSYPLMIGTYLMKKNGTP